MALKILLADDSMTAQNMGKKILVEGGYEVVTVSNGAAAVKKVNELKPDVVILDIYMPGYSGLEVCERLRKTRETAKIPVLLTVGKLEPFRPEDGNRAKADGLLIKPFEATDLLATVQKLAQKSKPAPPQETEFEETIRLERPIVAEVSDGGEAWQSSDQPAEDANVKIEVPQEMAVIPAFEDVLAVHERAADAPPAELRDAAAFEAAAAAAAAGPVFSVELPPAMNQQSAPAFEVADFPAPAPVFEPPAVEVTPVAGTAEAPRTYEPPTMMTAAGESLISNAPPADVEVTAANPQDLVANPLPDLEPTVLQDAIPVQVEPDAALVTDAADLSQFVTKFGVENPEDVPVGVFAPAEPEPEPLAEEVLTFEPPVHEPVAVEALQTAPEETQATAEEPLLATGGPEVPAESAFEDWQPVVAVSENILEEPERAEATVGDTENDEMSIEPEAEEIAVAPVEDLISSVSEPQRVQEMLEASAVTPDAAAEALLPEVAVPEPIVSDVEPLELGAEPPLLANEELASNLEPLVTTDLEPLGTGAEPAGVALPAEPTPVPEPQPEVVLPGPEPVAGAEPVAETQTSEPPAAEAAPAPTVAAEPLVSELATEHGIDETTAAQIVDRLIARLKPDLVAEITRALKRK